MAVEFDGANDYINCGSAAAIDNLFDGGGSLVCFMEAQSMGESNLGMILHKAGKWSFRLRNTGGAYINTLVLSYIFTGNDGAWRLAANSISLNTKYHLAITYNNSDVGNDPIIYVDGVSQAVTELVAPTGTRESDAAGDLYIGNNIGTTATFDGLISRVRAFDTILTADQIASLAAGYSLPLGGEILWVDMMRAHGIAHWDGTTLVVNTNYLPDGSVNDNVCNPTNSPVARASDFLRMGGVAL